jgi:hypothetical protein
MLNSSCCRIHFPPSSRIYSRWRFSSKSCLSKTYAVIANIKRCVKSTKKWCTKNPDFGIVVKFVFRSPGIKSSPSSTTVTRIGATFVKQWTLWKKKIYFNQDRFLYVLISKIYPHHVLSWRHIEILATNIEANVRQRIDQVAGNAL